MTATRRRLLIRADDAGMNMETNCGVEAVLKAGVARSVGVMACAPCFQDAVQRLRALPASIAVGVHLTLNAEWVGYRWRPLLPVSDVPSLVDDAGYLPANHDLYRDRPPKLDHVLAEIQAQIDTVRAAGLQPCYADEHMVFTASSPWMLGPIREIIDRAGLVYDRSLALSRFPGSASSMEALAEGVKAMGSGDALLVTHPAVNGPEMQMIHHSQCVPGQPGRERGAELGTLTDTRLADLLAREGVDLVSYRDFRTEA